MPPDSDLSIWREALLKEIEVAFDGVSREGGVSWSESVVIDLYGSDEGRAKAREQDKDTDWHELLEDPEWRSDQGVGGWSFLDPIGFAYYLPAAMVRSIRSGYDEGIEFHLTLRDGRDDWGPVKGAIDWKEYSLEKWSALSLPQRRAIRQFLEYMDSLTAEEQPSWPNGFFGWREALDRYWSSVD